MLTPTLHEGFQSPQSAHLYVETAVPVAQVFIREDSILLSSSKDNYIRAWQLSSQHCFQTLGGQRGEVHRR